MEKLKLLAVTACMSGVAHTYMAAELLTKIATKQNWFIKIETQGALGIDNSISVDDISLSDVVIIISNINIEQKDRFTQSRCIEMDISHFLIDSKQLLVAVKRIIKTPAGTHFKIKP